jgi:hypothetical protein
MKQGTITRWIREKRLGVLTPDDGKPEVRFTWGDICNSVDLEYVAAGMRALYLPAVNDKGPTSYHVYVVRELREAL